MFSFPKLCKAIAGRALALGLVTVLASAAASGSASAAGACQPITHEKHHFSVCTFDMRATDIRLFWQGPDGKPYGNFDALARDLATRGAALTFAMNAGMFHPDLSPVGLYIEGGSRIREANTRDGAGNFHLKPNGIFYFGGKTAGVMETTRFLKTRIKADFATQSGPLLVIGRVIHPKIQASGTSEKIRNGVGVRDGHIVIFAISQEPVTFHTFASLFRDRLDCPDALYLDGSVSSLYAPSLGRADKWPPLGPIIGVVERRGKGQD
jgi:uncharacterized protein YigE (DUF2233 family)